MEILRNLKQIPFEIANLLGLNQNIQRLVYNDNLEALTTEMVGSPQSILQMLLDEKYISFYPLTATGIDNIKRNTFIVINAEDFSLHDYDNNNKMEGNIYISTDESHYLLANNHIRLLELIDNIVSVLDNVKLSAAGILEINSINYVVFSDFRVGYRIGFTIKDQATRKAEL